MNRNFFISTAVIFLAGFLLGCVGSTKVPVETLWYESKPDLKPNLIIYLRGMGGATNCFLNPHQCFEEKGFVSVIRERNLPFDMVSPNLHYGYYRDRSFVKRLKEDVINPAKAKGYEKIWIVGVSMGALGSIFYIKDHPGDIDGVVALAPFLGDDEILDEIIENGGLRNWDSGEYDKVKEWQRDIWRFLKDYEHDNPEQAPIYLGIGNKDLYIKGQKLLAEYLQPERVLEIEGKHRYATFKTMWDMFLDQDILNH